MAPTVPAAMSHATCRPASRYQPMFIHVQPRGSSAHRMACVLFLLHGQAAHGTWLIPNGCNSTPEHCQGLMKTRLAHMNSVSRRWLRKGNRQLFEAAGVRGGGVACRSEVTLVCTDVEGSTAMWEWNSAVMQVRALLPTLILKRLSGCVCLRPCTLVPRSSPPPRV